MIQVTFLCSNAWFKYFVNILSCNYKPACKIQDFSSLCCWVLVENSLLGRQNHMKSTEAVRVCLNLSLLCHPLGSRLPLWVVPAPLEEADYTRTCGIGWGVDDINMTPAIGLGPQNTHKYPTFFPPIIIFSPEIAQLPAMAFEALQLQF